MKIPKISSIGLIVTLFIGIFFYNAAIVANQNSQISTMLIYTGLFSSTCVFGIFLTAILASQFVFKGIKGIIKNQVYLAVFTAVLIGLTSLLYFRLDLGVVRYVPGAPFTLLMLSVIAEVYFVGFYFLISLEKYPELIYIEDKENYQI